MGFHIEKSQVFHFRPRFAVENLKVFAEEMKRKIKLSFFKIFGIGYFLKKFFISVNYWFEDQQAVIIFNILTGGLTLHFVPAFLFAFHVSVPVRDVLETINFFF